MYQTIRKQFYWPGLALSCNQAVKAFSACARQRIKLQSNSTTQKLFHLSGPLEDIAMDLLGQLWPTSRGHTQLLVIIDRFTKMVRAILLKTVSAFDVARAFTRHWAFAYGILKTVLTGSNSMLNFCNRTILSSLRRFIADHPKDWDFYTDALTYKYNTQAHSSTGYAPMELTISRLTPHIAIENYSQPTKNVRLSQDAGISNLGKLVGEFQELIKAKQRYRKNYDKHLHRTKKEVIIDPVEPAPRPKDDHSALMPQLRYTSKRNTLEGGEEYPTEAQHYTLSTK
eukprot:IDg3323t1